MAFPHYDARPRRASFPQSAETYLRATDERGRFAQREASLLVGPRGGDRAEPAEVTRPVSRLFLPIFRLYLAYISPVSPR